MGPSIGAVQRLKKDYQKLIKDPGKHFKRLHFLIISTFQCRLQLLLRFNLIFLNGIMLFLGKQ